MPRKVTYLKGTKNLTVKDEGRWQVLPMTLELKEFLEAYRVCVCDAWWVWYSLGTTRETFQVVCFPNLFLGNVKSGNVSPKTQATCFPWQQSQSLFMEWACYWASAIYVSFILRTHISPVSLSSCAWHISVLYCKIKHCFFLSMCTEFSGGSSPLANLSVKSSYCAHRSYLHLCLTLNNSETCRLFVGVTRLLLKNSQSRNN